jgi:hypothetical protein
MAITFKKLDRTNLVKKVHSIKKATEPVRQKEIVCHSDYGGFNVDVDEVELFSIDSETNQNCCGIEDIGNLECLEPEIYTKLSIKERKEMAKCIDSEVIRRGKGARTGVLTFLLSTNDKEETKEWTELMKYSTVFVPVKSFKNRSSGNIVTIWVSNN